jgi:hypothetical protein
MFSICSFMGKRIAVTSAELGRAIRVWLRVMPKPVWRALEAYQLAALDKRHDPDEAPPVHGAVADHIVGQMERAEWAVTRPEPPPGLGSPPPWRGGG